MATLFRDDNTHTRPNVLVFGSGTVGRPIRRHLQTLGLRAHGTVDVPWVHDEARRSLLHQLREQVRSELGPQGLRVVWAAGVAGFSATPEQTSQEAAAFEDVIGFVEALTSETERPQSVLHVVSSAGGLFEGRTIRSADAVPSPQRAYGRLKLLQEHTAMRLGAGAVVVHRPSSIYGTSSPAGRPGLIGAMVANAAAQLPSTIYGSPTTLRDFVHAEDVGRHIATAALTDGEQASPQFLVSGRPASIHEVVGIVEAAMRRPVLLRYVDPWNTSDIVFTRSSRAAGFRPDSLQVGVRRLRAAWLARPRQMA